MSANFYLSSHANNHLHPHAALLMARVDDLKHATELELAWIEIWSASSESALVRRGTRRQQQPPPDPLSLDESYAAMQKICKRLGLRQQVLATAIVFFRRFYLRNSYCDTDPTLVAATCCYLAAKAEETPVHVKTAANEAKAVFHGTPCRSNFGHAQAEHMHEQTWA